MGFGKTKEEFYNRIIFDYIKGIILKSEVLKEEFLYRANYHINCYDDINIKNISKEIFSIYKKIIEIIETRIQDDDLFSAIVSKAKQGIPVRGRRYINNEQQEYRTTIYPKNEIENRVKELLFPFEDLSLSQNIKKIKKFSTPTDLNVDDWKNNLYLTPINKLYDKYEIRLLDDFQKVKDFLEYLSKIKYFKADSEKLNQLFKKYQNEYHPMLEDYLINKPRELHCEDFFRINYLQNYLNKNSTFFIGLFYIDNINYENADKFNKIKQHLHDVNNQLIIFLKKRSKCNKKIKITINEEDGVFLENNKDKCYSIKRRSKRVKIINSLKDGYRTGPSLIDFCSYSNHVTLTKEINNINKCFKKELEVKNDLIIHIKTGGYKLNKKIFHINQS